MSRAKPHDRQRVARLTRLLDGRPIVLVGMMGAGKTSVGRRLAAALGWRFIDSDTEIEQAAGMSIADFFAAHGEDAFRSGEARVIARLLGDRETVLATGGGAFMTKATRDFISEVAISVWISADLDLLFSRVSRRSTRPLLKTPDPKQTLKDLMDAREPTYALADVIVRSRDAPQSAVAGDIVEALIARLETPEARDAEAIEERTND